MVLFMEGSNVRDINIPSSELVGERPEANDRMIDSVVKTLPFDIDKSFVYHLDELNLTFLASGFFGDIYKVSLIYNWIYFSSIAKTNNVFIQVALRSFF